MVVFYRVRVNKSQTFSEKSKDLWILNTYDLASARIQLFQAQVNLKK